MFAPKRKINIFLFVAFKSVCIYIVAHVLCLLLLAYCTSCYFFIMLPVCRACPCRERRLHIKTMTTITSITIWWNIRPRRIGWGGWECLFLFIWCWHNNIIICYKMLTHHNPSLFVSRNALSSRRMCTCYPESTLVLSGLARVLAGLAITFYLNCIYLPWFRPRQKDKKRWVSRQLFAFLITTRTRCIY